MVKNKLVGNFLAELLKAIPVTSNLCARVLVGQTYYVPNYMAGDVCSAIEQNTDIDDNFYNTAMYYNNPEAAKQVALHSLLYRQLLKFAYDNNYLSTRPWNVDEPHYEIIFSHIMNDVVIDSCFTTESFSHVNFCSYDAAKRAIEKIVRPFMKEHPDFVW